MLDLAYNLWFANPSFRRLFLAVGNRLENREKIGDGSMKRREFHGNLINARLGWRDKNKN